MKPLDNAQRLDIVISNFKHILPIISATESSIQARNYMRSAISQLHWIFHPAHKFEQSSLSCGIAYNEIANSILAV